MPKESEPAKVTHLLSSAEQRNHQDGKRKPASKGHSHPVERRARDSSGQRKKASQRGALTPYRAQSDGLFRTAKERRPTRGTHVLSSAERRTHQDSKGKPASEEHSRTIQRRARDSSGQLKKASQRGALTSWPVHNDGLVRTAKENQPARVTHQLSSAERQTRQDSERKPASGEHLLPVECRARNWSGRQNKAGKRGALTNCQAQTDGLVRTAKKRRPAKGTHSLPSVWQGSRQDSK
jgi:hypothetical protein